MELASFSETKRRVIESLRRGDIAGSAFGSGISPRHWEDPAPLSPAQERLWLLEMTPGIPPVYNESVTVRRKGELNEMALERTLAEIVRRHEIWRTSFQTMFGQPVQVVHGTVGRLSLSLVDLRREPAHHRAEELLRVAQDQARIRFDLLRGPLLRFLLVRMKDDDHRLLVTAHQSTVDGVSVYQIFPSELAHIYTAFSRGLDSQLPVLPVQFRDFAAWHRDYMQGEVRDRQLEFWRKALHCPPAVPDWPPRATQSPTFRGAIRSFSLPGELTRAVDALRRAQNVTLFVVLTSVFSALLYHYTRQADLMIGTLAPAGRKRSEVQRLMGYFLNPVVLRLNFTGDPPFSEHMRRTAGVIASAISNDDVPFQDVVQELGCGQEAMPFFRVAISLQPFMHSYDGWSTTSMDAESGGAWLDFYVAFIQDAEGLHVRVQYNPDLFEECDIARFVRDYETVLGRTTAHPSLCISQLAPAA